jgi:hypothetical protein
MGLSAVMTTTRVRVIGASEAAVRQLRAVAPARLDVVDEPIAEPDWIVVTTGDQRTEAIHSSGLPPFRVLEIPAIAGELDVVAVDALKAVLAKAAGIGVRRATESPLGVRLASMIVRRLTLRSMRS